MKKNSSKIALVIGFIILLGGLFTYGLGFHELLPIPRPDLLVVGTSLIGTMFIVVGTCSLAMLTDKSLAIEENDERNIAIRNVSMAYGFIVMSIALAIVTFALIFMGYMNIVSAFSMIGVLLLGQLVFMIEHWRNSKKM